jgi:hypothetical protein
MSPGTVVRLSTDRLGRFGRPLVVILGPGELIGFREHGCRRVYTTTIGACAALAVKQAAIAEWAAKAAKRKARR